MIIDKLVSYDVNATITGGTTTDSVDVVDHGVNAATALPKLGTGEQLYLCLAIKSNTGGDGADTMQFSLATGTDVAVSAGKVTLAISPVVTGVANLPAGTKVAIPVPSGVSFKRYTRVNYAVTATAVLVVDAWLSNTPPPDATIYPDAI